MQSLIYKTTVILLSFIAVSEVRGINQEELDDVCRNILKTPHYEYKHFFPSKKGVNNSTELNFKLKADRDANIIFSQNVFPKYGDQVYEIILGVRSTKGAVIRKTAGGPDDAVTIVEETPIVLSNEWREFWVKIQANTVEVGRKGKKAFMVLEDSKEIPIKYYSVTGWRDSNVLWSLPCIEEKDFSE